MTIHTPITIRTAPETCIARTQRPFAERLLAGIFYIDVALDVGPTSSVLAHAAPSQSDPRCHRQRSLTPMVSRPHSRRMSRVRVPSLPTSENHRKTNRLRQYERHPALASWAVLRPYSGPQEQRRLRHRPPRRHQAAVVNPAFPAVQWVPLGRH